ncbi:DNA polymerase phi-domain-containing protein [Ganoderma leucocontextum]|nr:DNA polymerase phi-domain-containing protein [Ganoderma leucocontextum]
MSTTLPLFWHLSSANKKERLDASVKLVAALEHFQSNFVPKESPETSQDEEEDEDEGRDIKKLDALNAQDVSYSLRRLIRGLASPRESSRLGFAVALTELLSHLDTVTCSQIVQLILDSSKTQGSMTGQEERDVFFARLFGLTSVIQSGLLLRDTTLPSSSTVASDAASFKEVLDQLLELGEKKSWLRESVWCSICFAVDALSASDVSWKDDALDATVAAVYSDAKTWTPEKLALTLKLQAACESRDWKKLLSPTFKNPDLLSTGNLGAIARILKESDADEDKETDIPKSGSWKPQIHFVWDTLLDQVLPQSPQSGERLPTGSFPDFFRIVVDESLFASTSSPERKYWGFQVFQKVLPRVSADDMPMLFTKNFMRSWINHLSNSDRYLHKAARQVATDVQNVVKSNPTIGFSLILQLTGVHGSRQFDRLTKTKTVEAILTSMDDTGIQSYIAYLLKQVDEEPSASVDTETDFQAVNTRRAWIIDQLAALVRNGAIPKSDAWIQTILDWLAVHGLFIITKKAEKSAISALRSVPSPAFSEELRRNCRERLLACLADLTVQTTLIKEDTKSSKVAAVASDGRFWVSRVLSTIEQLEKDTKHVKPLSEPDEEEVEQRQKLHEILARLKDAPEDRREAARGVELLLSATVLHAYCAEEDDADPEPLENCLDGASRMFPAEAKKGKKGRKSSGAPGEDKGKEKEVPEPVDVLVDTIIGFLEKGTAYMRAVANQVFALLAGAVQASTIDLILTQLERRDPDELVADEEDVEMDDEEEDVDGEEDESGSSSSSSSAEEDEDEDGDEEANLELRRKIEEALRVNGISAATGDSDSESEEELMDDEQMLAIDEQLSAAFKARAAEKRHGKDVDAQREATHFKNRVLDLIDIFVKKHPANPLIVRLIFPLVELIVSTGPDEKQLSDKATGILRNRIGKSKESPNGVSKEDAAKTLEELHILARKASTPDVLATLNQCSLYLSKVLLHAEEIAPVLSVYRESLHDFVARKASKLSTAFFDDFVKRHAQAAWDIRDDLVKASGEALNGYRQAQVFHLVQTLVNQLQAPGDKKSEVLAFMPSLRKAILNTISKACSDESTTLQPAHVKDILKLALVAVRQTKRAAENTDELSTVWRPSKWTELSKTLGSNDRFKASVGLQAMCKQIVKLLQESSTAGSKAKTDKAKNKEKEKTASATKRKAADGEGEDGDEEVADGQKKAKHKKARKAKSS